jgi:hypothetical protein
MTIKAAREFGIQHSGTPVKAVRAGSDLSIG